jgi:hypothetical protein
MIAAVPITEVEKMTEKSGSAKNGAGLKKRKNGNAKESI